MTILPLTYLGGVEWFSLLANGDCVIDTGENWVKQTARNRADILTANGVASLTVPVHGYGRKIRTRDVRIDNSKRWQHSHWMSIVSAYRNSPFFDHYENRFAPVYAGKFDFLIDLNVELLNILAFALALRPPDGTDTTAGTPGGAVKISEKYIVPSPGDFDLRGKKALRRAGDLTAMSHSDTCFFQPYTQVFSDRLAFTPGLSVIDLLFCEGPSARNYLQSRRLQFQESV